MSAVARGLGALGAPDARRFLTGQAASSLGNWMQGIGEAWLVLQLTDDNAMAVGLLAATKQVPSIALGLWGGLVADRYDRRRLATATQLVLTASTALLGLLTGLGVVSTGILFALVAVNGLALVVDVPARQALLADTVPDHLLPSAISLNSAIFNGARIVGPALAALAITLTGTAACFLLNSASYLVMIAMLRRMDPPPGHGAGSGKGWERLREGLATAWRHRPLRANLVMLAIVGTMAINFNVVLPVLARHTFDGSANVLGTFTSAMGIGCLAGAITVATAARPSARFVAAHTVAFGMAVALAAAAPTRATVTVALVATGFFSITLLASSNTKLLLDTPPAMRGRISSLRAMAVGGSSAVGAPIAGTICQLLSPRWALLTAAAAVLVAAGAYVRIDPPVRTSAA